MKRPMLLDLFCGAGGAAMGYYRAGFDVYGIDIKPQPNYPFQFLRGDALEFAAKFGREFDAIHASPPCQTHSSLAAIHKNNPKYQEKHLDLIPQTRELLIKLGKPWIMENVPGSTLKNFVTLCGTHFNLKVYRHRWFESSVLLMVPGHQPHNDQTPSAGRGLSPKGFVSVSGTGGITKADYIEIVDGGETKLVKTTDCAGIMPNGFVSVCGNFGYLDYASRAMGIDWMSRKELSQAIPPAYTEFLGKQLIKYVKG